ncbi:MAG: bifunctional salicylyl-CoA 5-hydroxylase/oxidoreductase [Burkholderiaceae bacterium]
MNIDIIGAGPAGLYFAILIKKSRPEARIKVTERNRADDTFGFGIVLSDETLTHLEAADGPSHAAIRANFAYWDDIYTHFQGQVLRSSGHGFSGIKRLVLLNILQQRAAELGVKVEYGVEDLGWSAHPDADLIVAADGINSPIRESLRDHFQPEVELRSNRFVWLGAKMSLPGFTYSFREDESGIWNLHAYQYAPGECTLVVETTERAFQNSGLEASDEAATARHVERLFARELNGSAVLTNRSWWRQFPTIRCRTWHSERIVLLGDAAHTAHFSIGSGTKLALEDAIALHAALMRVEGPIEDALEEYETTRRDEVSRIQHAADVSLVWFENVARFWHFEPMQFNYSLLSRSKQITHENLRMRDAGLVSEVEAWWTQGVARELAIEPPQGPVTPPLFAPFRLRELWLVNRVVVSPMAQYSALDGLPNEWHLVHYGSRALGGAGLLFTEMTCVSPTGRITPGCTGLWNQDQADAWQKIVRFVHENSDTRICMQLGHSGRKGSTQLGWQEIDRPLAADNWDLIAPSPIAYRPGVNAVPRAMSAQDMDEVCEQFVASARLAEEAGFDMLEVHMAHGYLLASFLSAVTNRREDAFGGSLTRRLAYPLRVFDAVRAVWPRHKPLSVRVSATDWIPGGMTGQDAVEIARVLKDHGCDLIDVSSGQTDPQSRPVYGRMYQAGFSEQIRLEAGIATMAVGAITTADQINTLLVSGRADLVALARPHLADPYFTLHAALASGFTAARWPRQYLTGAEQGYVLARRAREEAALRPPEPRGPAKTPKAS